MICHTNVALSYHLLREDLGRYLYVNGFVKVIVFAPQFSEAYTVLENIGSNGNLFYGLYVRASNM